MYSAEKVKELLATSVDIQIHVASRESCLHALEHAWIVNKSPNDMRNAVIQADNSLELLFKSIILLRGKSFSKDLKLPDCLNILKGSYETLRKQEGQLLMLHEYRNRAYHHGDTPNELIVTWAVKTMLTIFKELDRFDAEKEFFDVHAVGS